jgi:hypothetical protein
MGKKTPFITPRNILLGQKSSQPGVEPDRPGWVPTYPAITPDLLTQTPKMRQLLHPDSDFNDLGYS